MFNETIWIIALSYHNTSCSSIHCMDKNINSINEQNSIYFYPKYMGRNTGIVTWACSELCNQWSWDVFQNKSDFLDGDNQNTFCLTRSVAITIIWTTANRELLLVPVSYILSLSSNRASDDGGKGSAVCKCRTGGTSVSLSHPVIPACHSRRESLSPLLPEFTWCQTSVKSKYLLFKDK